MDFEERKRQIDESMNQLSILIIETKKVYDNILNNIDNQIKSHNEFRKFVEGSKIFELYLWSNIKENYMGIKKKITKNKKINKTIINTFSNLYTYYDNNNKNRIEQEIKNLENNKNQIDNNFLRLKRIHNELTNKCRTFNGKNEFIKIIDKEDKLIDRLKILHQIHKEIQEILYKMKLLDSEKKNLLIDIELLKKN
jgi:hypothetical protein